jgi:hypothetical protein
MAVQKPKIPKKYIEPYYKILKRLKPKIGVKRRIEVKLMRGFQFDPFFKTKYIINCPPYFKEFEPAFVHYLVHAKMLEDGWPLVDFDYKFTDKGWKQASITKEEFEKKPKQEREQIYFGLYNRSADSFFDFYVWNHLNKIDKKYFMNFTSITVKQKTKEIVKGFEKWYHKEKGFKLHAYVCCIDWFVMFYLVAKNTDKKRAKELNDLYKRLFRSKKFLKLVPSDTKRKIEWLRKFYTELYSKYPTHTELLKNKSMQRAFKRYYNHIWKNSGFEIKIKGFE